MRSRSLLTGAALVAAACGGAEKPAAETDPKLAALTVGMSRDSVLMVLGATATDTLPNINRKEMYLLNGVPLEVLFYSPAGVKMGTEPAPAESTLRPIVLQVNRVTGWGWAHFDSVARVNDLRVKMR